VGSVASSHKRPVRSKKRNIKKQILDFGMRILDLRYSVHLKRMNDVSSRSRRRSLKRFHHSSIDIRHFFHKSAASGKKTASLIQKKKLCQINAILISDELICRFVLVLVLVLESFEPL